jgi:hypothetical protein
MLSRSDLEGAHATEGPKKLVADTLAACGDDVARWLVFAARYIAWNGDFGSQVASLAGRLGGSGAFLEDGIPVPEMADRSVLVASFFFDAARDEFDDRDTKHRDTHRCLAQAFLTGMVDYARSRDGKLDAAKLLARPAWISVLRRRVRQGYGLHAPDELPFHFRAMGYHLGSEVLADGEFSTIDAHIRTKLPALHAHLSSTEVAIAGEKHNAYQWVRIHSGHGGGAEADHFAWAVRGVTKAFDYVPKKLHDELHEQTLRGYIDFVHDHDEFFTSVRREIAR